MDLDIYDVLTIDTGGLYLYRWFSTFHEPLIENISSSLIFHTKMPFIIISYYVNFREKTCTPICNDPKIFGVVQSNDNQKTLK